MAAPSPAYFPQPQLDGKIAVYSADGTLVLSDIETLGDARDHILDLIAADQQAAFKAVSDDLADGFAALIAEAQAEAQADRAALDDFEAQAHAMAYGPALTSEAA